MKTRYIILCLLSSLILAIPLWAAAAEDLAIQLEQPKFKAHDMAAISRGAKVYRQHCMVCHAMKYLVHDARAKAMGIRGIDMPINNQQWHLGLAPPDLSLMARIKGAPWLYTYLHSFYQDPKQALGVNNLLSPNINMPNILGSLQGQQTLVSQHQFKTLYGQKPHYYNLLKHTSAGSLTPHQFDQLTSDLVAFMVYASEPHAVERERLGWWVLGFLLIVLMVAWLLKKEYWRDIK